MPIHRLSAELVEEIRKQYPGLQELNLSRNEIRFVENLDQLSGLQSLDLSSNRLQHLSGVEALKETLQQLHVGDNQLSTLEGLQQLSHLEVLHAEGNRIQEDSFLDVLAAIPSLRSVSLAGNPVCSQPRYREKCVQRLPALEELDGQPITAGERLFLRLKTADGDSMEEEPEPLPSSSKPRSLEHQGMMNPPPPTGTSKLRSQAQQGVERRSKEKELENRDLRLQVESLREVLKQSEVKQKFQEMNLNKLKNKITELEEENEDLHRRLTRSDARVQQQHQQVIHLQEELHLYKSEALQLQSSTSVQKQSFEEKFLHAKEEHAAMMARIREEHEAEVQRLCDELAETKESLTHMRNYFAGAESLELHRSRDGDLPHAHFQFQGAPSEAAVSQEEYNRVQNTAQLLEVQLCALQHIVHAQERQLTTHGAKSGADSLDMLQRWREKVFALLVQLRSQELVNQDTRREHGMQLAELEEQLRDAQDTEDIQKQQIVRLEAKLALEQDTLAKTRSALQRAEMREQKLLREAKRHEKGSRQLVEQVQKSKTFWDQILSVLASLDRKVQVFEARLDYACSRVRLIHGGRMVHDKKKRTTSALGSSRGGQSCDMSGGRHPSVTVEERRTGEEARTGDSPAELEAAETYPFHEERDRLVRALREAEDKLQESSVSLEEESVLRARLARVQGALSTALQEKDQLQEELVKVQSRAELLQDSIQTGNQKIHDLEALLEETRYTASCDQERAIQEAVEPVERALERVEQECNETKREHAKTLIHLRQLERELSREKARYESETSGKLQFFEEKLSRKEEESRNLRRERNALLATLREYERQHQMADLLQSNPPAPVPAKRETRISTPSCPQPQKATPAHSSLDISKEDLKHKLDALSGLASSLLADTYLKDRGHERQHHSSDSHPPLSTSST